MKKKPNRRHAALVLAALFFIYFLGSAQIEPRIEMFERGLGKVDTLAGMTVASLLALWALFDRRK